MCLPKTKNNWSNLSTLKIYLLGVACIVLVALLITIVFAVFITNEYLDITKEDFLAVITQFISVFLGTFVAGKITQEKKLMICGAVTATCMLAYTSIGILFFDGIGSGLVSGLIATVLGFACAFALCNKAKKATGSRRRRSKAR